MSLRDSFIVAGAVIVLVCVGCGLLYELLGSVVS